MAILNSTEIYVNATDGRTNAYKYKIDTILNSQSIANNSSNITITFSVMAIRTYYTQWNDSDAIWITTSNNGANINNSSAIRGQTSTPSYNTWYQFGSITNDYPHKSDGTLTVSTSVTYGFYSQTYLPYETTISTGNVAVTTIPRASTWSASSYPVNLGQAVNLVLTGYSSSFTDTVTWSYGSYSGTIMSQSATSTSAKNISFTPSNFNDICNLLANTSSISVVVTCTTKNGSTVVGKKTTTVAISVPSSVKPTISIGDIASSLKSTLGLNNNEMVGGYGTGSASVSYSNANAWDKSTSAITSVSINRGSASYSGSTVSLGVQPSTSTNTNATLTVVMTNSRGVSNSATKSISVKGYTAPTISNYYANRSGTTITMGWTYTWTSIGNNAVQTHTIKLGSGSAVSVDSGESTTAQLSASASSTATFYLSDKITSTQQVKAVPRLQVPISLYDGGGTTLATSFGEQASNYGSGANYVNFASGTTLRGIDSNNAIYTRDAWQVVKGELKTGDAQTLNANDLTTSGTYYLTSSSSNIPVAYYGTITTMCTSTYATQLFTRMTTGTDYPKIWIRKYNSGWTSWTLLTETFTLLWENSSTSSSFASQTISLDLASYNYVAIRFIHSTSYQSTNTIAIINRSRQGLLQSISGGTTFMTGALSIAIRNANTSTTGITFSSAVVSNAGATYSTNNAYCIPIQIFGIR